MNLRAIRLRLTLLYTALSAIAIVALAVVGVRAGTERIEDGATREGEQVVAGVLRQYQQGDSESNDEWPGNTWQVHIGDDEEDVYDYPFGETWTEPPLYSVAEQALEYDYAWARYEQDETPYLVYAERIGADDAVVTAVELSYYQARASSLRLRIGLAAAGAVLGVGIVGWFVSGRSLRPIRLANARQRDFIADAAHELRTPLAVIRASASQALSKPRSTDDYVAALGEIDSAAVSAGAAVAELLELARIDSGQFSPRTAPLRLDLMAEEVTAGVRVDGCTLEASAERAITVDADYGLLHHAVENVVRNAAARASNVSISTSVDGKRAVVTVSDNGPGFPPDLLADVFDRFRRGDSRGSSGLGLAIARSIIQAHGGGADARNGADGGGAIVRLWLPYRGERR